MAPFRMPEEGGCSEEAGGLSTAPLAPRFRRSHAYGGAGKTWTIANCVPLGSGIAPAAYSGRSGSKLVDKGVAFSRKAFGQ